MNAELKALQDERTHLLVLGFKTMNQHLPFNVQIGGHDIPSELAGKARFGITNVIAARLREIEQRIREIKKEKNA